MSPDDLRAAIRVSCSRRLCRGRRCEHLRAGRALQHLGMAQRAHGVVVAGAPVLLHGPAGELVILATALVALRAIDQLDDVVDLVVGFAAPAACTSSLVAQLVRQLLDERWRARSRSFCVFLN